MKGVKTTTNKDEIDIIELYLNKNLNPSEIAKQYNLSDRTILRILRRNNINVSRNAGFYFRIKKKDVLNDILKLYNEDVPVRQMVDKLGICDKTIVKVLKENNLVPKPINYFQKKEGTDKDKDILNLYINKEMSMAQVRKELKTDTENIIRCLKENNIRIKSWAEHNRYKLNENYFETIDSDAKAWLLGWICTDGFTNQKTGVLGISINEGDIKIIELFKKLIESEKPISIYQQKDNGAFKNNFRTATLRFNNLKMAKDLYRLGLDNNKTYSLKFPPIDEKYFYSLLKGSIEGDGEIRIGYNKKKIQFMIALTGTKEFCKGFTDLLGKIGIFFGVRKTKYKNKEGYFYRIYTHHKLNIIKILDKMYENHNGLFLDRKYNVYLEMKRILQENPVKEKHITNARKSTCFD